MKQIVDSHPVDADLMLQKNPAETKEETADGIKAVNKEISYWNNFYAGKFDIAAPSQFCVLMATEADKNHPIVEFGCGNGRDSIYLARHGFVVFAGDISKEAVHKNTEKEAECKDNHNPAKFRLCDVACDKDVQALVQQARKASNSDNITAYNRFFLHTLDHDQEHKFLTVLSKSTIPGDQLYMEFRCSLDANQEKLYKDHYRRYVDTAKLVKFLQEELEFKVEYEITGKGLAKYKAEDPYVSRIIATRR